MKASYMKDNVLALEPLGPDVAARIRAACAEQVEKIEKASRADWLPVTLDVDITEAIALEAGDEAMLKQARLALLSSMEGPLLRPLRDVTIRVFGAHPHAVMKLAPKAWPMIFRDCGELEYDAAGKTEGVLRLKNAAPEFLASDTYRRGTGATFDALATVGGAKSAATTVEVRDSIIQWTVRWT
jgi:hypothetical protein